MASKRVSDQSARPKKSVAAVDKKPTEPAAANPLGLALAEPEPAAAPEPAASTTKIETIRIADITRDPALVCRAHGVNERVAGEYRDLILNGTRLPPPVVFRGAEGLFLADGHHRLRAAELAGLTEIACEVRPGDRQAALVFAAGSNSSHGARRSRSDARHAVLLLIRSFPAWSDRQLGAAAHVDGKTVAAVRKATAEFPQLGRTGKDGKVRRAPKAKRDKGARELRALKPFGRLLDKLAAQRPEVAGDVHRVTDALAALLARLEEPATADATPAADALSAASAPEAGVRPVKRVKGKAAGKVAA